MGSFEGVLAGFLLPVVLSSLVEGDLWSPLVGAW